MYRPFPDSSRAVNPSQPADVGSKICELSQDLSTAFNTGNYDHVAALFGSDGLFMAPGNEPVQGPKAIERKLGEFGENGYQDLRRETTRVDCSGDVAIEVGRYTLTIRAKNGSIIQDRGKYLTVWRRLGAWLIVGDCWSSSVAKAETPAIMQIPVSENQKPVIDSDVPKSA